MIWLVMGVTGCGKTTLGKALADRLNISFFDADDFHPPNNRTKLLRDEPLTDMDRWPWLGILASKMPEWNKGGGAVLACSALKDAYRQVLANSAVPMRVVWIEITPEQAKKRLSTRKHDLVGQYEKILQGQFADLEKPRGAVTVPAGLGIDQQVDWVIAGGDSH
ncbi:MAG: gluconokinase [Verrucomicrobia bacterium]|nr:gluconokinase [Verrucomicrobiota bacterium]